ncbi:hypothetical protein [Novosphingobium sp. ST904]|uniref:hypothetical protein n=1 Tax=Novosphingobium sp. ST904 TaxID=1684385 RepID=UPI0006C86FAA|nr:hypothetical protein [Novosphingobium sp. ST904]KPH60374.1 hypothetical protein ADT71_19890 [Novosphingobium sp. ST904]TCM40078.1 hypothetical protein EDF59_105318 [Novosphingobium sp. ST904]
MTEPLPTIAQIAAEEYRLRVSSADRKVAMGVLSQDRADALIAPWQSIALLSWAAVPELAFPLAEARRAIVHYPGGGKPAVHDHLIDEDLARVLLAGDICGPNVWGPTLSKARDAALAKATTPEKIDRARNLCRLARALEVPLTLASCTPPTVARPERKAA